MKSRNATAIAWAFAAAQELPKGPWSILMMLARRVNNRREDFDVWPGQELIAEDSGVSLASVKRHLNLLESGNWLTRTRRTAAGRGFTGITYTLNVVAHFEMPNGAKISADFYGDEGHSRQLKTGGPVAQVEPYRQLTGELPNREHNKGELIEEESPVVPTATAQAALFDLPAVEPGPTFDDAISERFVKGWKQLAEKHDRVPSMRTLDKKRRAALLTRVRENITGEDIPAGEALVDELFKHIEGSPYLCGEKTAFVVRPDQVISPSGFLKTMERPNERNDSDHRPMGSGSSSVVAGARALEMLRNRRARAA